jgi:hypothetical protein
VAIDRRTIQANCRVGVMAPQIIRGYRNGLSLAQLAEFYGVAPNTIKRVLILNNVARRRPGRPKSKGK